MTSPGGGGHNDINLAALWIPVMPETSHMGEEMRKAGGEAKKQFEQGFNSAGSSPEQYASTYMGKFRQSMSKEFSQLEIPFGGSKVAEWFDKFGGEVDQKVVAKLKGQATEALRSYAAEHEKLVAATQRVSDVETSTANVRKAAWDMLTEAQQKHMQVQYGEAQAMDHVAVKASAMLPLIQQQTQAHTALTEQVTRTTAAHDQLTSVTGKLHDEQSKAATTGEMLAGAMGGLVVVGAGLALKAVEAFADMLKEGFEGAIEVTKELAKQTLELGDKYEQIGVGIREFSTASGEAFDNLESHAQTVFGTLDVAGANTGQTFAQLTSIMGGVVPDVLVKHIEELQGRFTSLKAQNLASLFYDFKVPIQQADSALASLLQSARGSGQDLGQLTTALSGAMGLTLQQANLNLEQSGAFMADLMKMGEPGRQVMGGLATAMKDFKAENLSFGDGMKLAGEELKAFGDTAKGQDLAEGLFGTRNWIVAKNAAQDYVDVVAKGPDAFNANSASVDQFLADTQQLSNKWEEIKHKIEEALMPIGLGAVDLVGGLIGNLKTSFDQHLPEIRAQVKKIGDSFLDNLPAIKDFVAGSISLMGPLFDFMKEGMLLVSGTLGGLVDIYAQVTGDDKLHESMVKFGEAQKKLQDIDFTKLGDNVSSFVSGIDTSSDDIKKKFDAMWDSARGQGADQQSPGAPIPDMTPTAAGGFPAAAGGFPAPVGGAPVGGPVATGASADPFAGPYAGSPAPGQHHADWDAIAAKEGGGQWNVTYPTGVPEGGGLQIKPETWQQYGGLAIAPKPYMATKEQQEEIGDRILNGWNGIPGQGPAAWDNGRNYVERKAKGGAAGNGDGLGRLITSGSGSGDDVAALLKRGEYVWDTETMDKFGWLVTALHQGTSGFGQGGDVGGVSQVIWSDLEDPTVQAAGGDAGVGVLYGSIVSGGPGSPYSNETNSGGNGFAGHHGHVHTTFNADPFTGLPYTQVPAGTNTAAGEWSAFPPWVKRLGDMYGLDAKTYAGHQEWNGANHGIDWWPRGKLDMSGKSYTHQDDAALSNFAAAAMAVGSGRMQGFAQGAGSGGADSYGGLGSTPGGKNGGLYPGLPGQYGGSGTYGGETYDQQVQAAQNVQSAKDQQADKNHAADVAQRRVDDLQAKLDAPPGDGKLGLLTGLPLTDPKTVAAEADKRKQLEEQLSDATYQLMVARRDAGEQVGRVSEAERKQLEAANKKPTGTQAGGNKDAQSLGSGLLQGIGQELGLGDVLGKSPLDWGIVKLAEGLFSYANGLGDAIFGKTDSGGGLFGGTPGGSQGLGDGLANGLLGSIGIKLPSAAISGAPNVIPGTPTPFGTGGPLPGPPQPGVVNNDNSINISPNVDAQAVLGPVQAQQNSYNSQAYQYAGGTPQQ